VRLSKFLYSVLHVLSTRLHDAPPQIRRRKLQEKGTNKKRIMMGMDGNMVGEQREGPHRCYSAATSVRRPL